MVVPVSNKELLPGQKFNKELLPRQSIKIQQRASTLIPLKLNPAVETRLQNAQTPTSTTSRSIDLPPPDSTSTQQNQPTQESEWVITIKQKLHQAQNDDVAGQWDKLCIYRIPQWLRENDYKAYIPQTVSLGPYHHGKKRLRRMDSPKRRALNFVLKRTNQPIELYWGAVKELEERARACYEGPICLSSKEFVEMMVLDACFVLELFRGAESGFPNLGYSRYDPIFAMRGIMHSIQRDMILLENQIPLFIQDRLYGLQSGCPDQNGVVSRLALSFFDPLMPTDAPLRNSNSFDPVTEKDDLHCLDVFRKSLLPVRVRPNPTPRLRSRVIDKRQQQLIHCVTELKDAGIKFKRGKRDNFLDIRFKNGILKIPRLSIHDGTKSLFLNLIAYEQCHLGCTNDITSYVVFMGNLIDSLDDVRYLHYHRIIENWLGSDQKVADMFNRLCQGVVFNRNGNDGSLIKLSEQVNRYYDHRWNAWRADLTHKYFNNPWSIISFIAAVILLALTLLQTFYTVYTYYVPPS